jgi:hypothetical protein
MAATKALHELIRQGHTRPRRAQPAAELVAARADVQRLLDGWNDTLANRLFADNFFLDNSRAWWQAEMARLVAVHGALHEDGPFEMENALRGTWQLAGERGWVNAFVTLTPTVPPRVQELTLESVLPPGPVLQSALDEFVKLLSHPTKREAGNLFAQEPDLAPDQHTLYDKIRIVVALCSSCKLGEILAGDGEGWVRLRIEGTKAAVEAELRLDEERKKFVVACFRQVR